MTRRALAALLALLLVWSSSGCASIPYPYAVGTETDLTLKLRPGETQIERGRPQAFVDGIGHYFFSLPSKLLLLSWRLDNHDISAETEEALQVYLRDNGLCDVKVRLNQYAPGAEWKRLFRNREMPGGWRYTFGLLSVSFYTIFPGRAFAGFPIIGSGDHYNPYTNTINLYSDLQPVGLHEGGHAKDFATIANRHLKGLYAGMRILPGFALWQELYATNDALGWEKTRAGSREEKTAYRSLYPAYGTYVGGTAGDIAGLFIDPFWIPYAIMGGVVVVGHIIGQIRALFVKDRPVPPETWFVGEHAPPGRCPTPGAAPAEDGEPTTIERPVAPEEPEPPWHDPDALPEPL